MSRNKYKSKVTRSSPRIQATPAKALIIQGKLQFYPDQEADKRKNQRKSKIVEKKEAKAQAYNLNTNESTLK